MSAKTEAEVAAELAKLKELQGKIRPYNVFKEDNEAALAAQIDVLENDMGEDDIWDEYGEDADNVREAALFAADWRNGDIDETDEEDSPAESWAHLRTKFN